MGEDRLNKFIKDKVFYHRTPTDGDALWAKIQAKQQKKKRRPILWIWWLGAALLISASLFGIYAYQNNIITDSQFQESPIATKNQNIEENCPEVQENLSTESPQKNSASLNKDNNTNVSFSSEKLTFEKSAVTSSSKRTHIKEKERVTSTPNSPLKKKPNQQTASSSYSTQEDLLKKVSPNFLPESKSNLILEPISNEVKKLSPEKVEEKLTNHEGLKNQNALPFLETSINLIIFNKKERKLSFNPKPILEDREKEEQNRPKNWQSSLGTHFYYGTNQRKLTAESDSSEIYKGIREDSEKTLDVFRGGVDFKLTHKKGFYGKVGLDYQQITEKLTTSFIESNAYLADSQVVHIIKYPNGSKIEILDSAMVTEIKTFDKKIFNRYRSLELPILFGYETSSKSDWHLFAEAGTSINISSKITGEISDPDGNAYNLKTDNNDWFKDNLGLAILGNIGASYDLNENWNVWLSPSFKYHLSNFSSNNNPIKQRHWNMGLSVGLRFVFP